VGLAKLRGRAGHRRKPMSDDPVIQEM